jgi:hypothetical protein
LAEHRRWVFEKWQFPHCLGAVDGKHIQIKKPPQSGSKYWNYKHYFSIVLLVVADCYGRVIAYDLGRPGSQGDSGIFNESKLSKLTGDPDLVPKPERIIPDGPEIPYFFVGDEAFALSDHMMEGYSKSSDDLGQRIFNYRLSRARRIV